MRLFCFPFAGGSASAFRSWPDTLGNHIEVVAIQPPGREGRFSEPPLREIDAALVCIRDAIRPLLDRPYAFFGHSLGSILAFETARLLRRDGLPQPRRLFVSGRRAPQVPLGRRPFHNLPDQELVDEIRKLSGDANGLFDSEEMRTLLLPIARADFALHDTYVHREEHPLDVPISVFGGLDDLTTSDENLRAWQAQSALPIRLAMLPGRHMFIDTARDDLLHAIASQLAPTAPPVTFATMA